MLKDIPGYEGIYAASDDGHIWSYKTNKFLSEHISTSGYLSVHIIADTDKIITVHRLVAMAFIENKENKPTVDHIDRNILNNKPSNLRWATISEQNKNRGWSEKRAESAKKGGLALSKQIECRDKNNHSILIRTFSSAYQAAIEMFNDPQKNSLIHRCAKGQKNSAYGYWWCYVKDNN